MLEAKFYYKWFTSHSEVAKLWPLRQPHQERIVCYHYYSWSGAFYQHLQEADSLFPEVLECLGTALSYLSPSCVRQARYCLLDKVTH